MQKFKQVLLFVLLFAMIAPASLLAEIIIDNSDAEFQIVGPEEWDTRYSPPWTSYGDDFRFNLTGNGEDRALYTVDITESGEYEVYGWWPTHAYCSQNTPYTIPFTDGTYTIRVNQQQNAGQWNFLATGYFEQGIYEITITDDADGVLVVADAIRLVPVSNDNNAPVLDSIGNRTVNEGELIEFTVTASDPDGDELEYFAENLPVGAVFDTDTQVFSWVPGYDEAGDYLMVFTVGDNGLPVLGDSEETTVTVINVNRPPVLDPIGNKAVDVETTLEFAITAGDQDSDELAYSADNLPDGASFDPLTQVFIWTPANGQSENFNVLFTVADNGEPILDDSEEIIIVVGGSNQPPVLTPIGNKIANEGELMEFTISATDPEGDALFYFAENLPQGASFDAETGLFAWVPDWQSSGEYDRIVFSVSDGFDTDEETIKIDVIDLPPLDAPTELSGEQINDSVELNWNASNVPELAGFNIFRSTTDPGRYEKLNDIPISVASYVDTTVLPGNTYYYFVTAVDIYNQTEVLASGLDFPLDITLNNEGLIFTGSWTQGVVWSIESDGSYSVYASGLGTIATLMFNNGDLFCSDWDGGSVYRITEDAQVITFGEGFDHPSGIAFNQMGEAFIAEDWGGRIFKTFDNGATWELFAEGLDGPGKIRFHNSGNLYVAEDLWVGEEFVGAIDIFHPDGTLDVLANITDPDGICFDQSGNVYVGHSTLNQVSRVRQDGSSMPVIQGITPWGCEINNFGELIVALPWDGQIAKIHLSHESDISDTVTVAIPSSNNEPVLDPIGSRRVDEGELLTFTVTGSDPDGDELTYSADNLPPGASFDPLTQVVSWIPDYVQAGNYSGVVFSATDDGVPAESVSESISITVVDVNRAPVLDPIGDRTADEGELLAFTVTGSDPDGDALRFSTGTLPPGAFFDSLTQEFTWTPGFGDGGNYQVLFTLTDEGDPPQSDSEAITITVGDVNRLPVLDPIGNKAVNEGELLEFTITATDPDGGSLTFSAGNLPSGASFDAVSQQFSWTPAYGQAGSYANILFTVTDDGNPPQSDSEAITITVRDVNRLPVLDPIGDRTADEGELLAFTVTGSDPDGDALRFSTGTLPPGAFFDSLTQEFTWTPGFGDGGNYQVLFTLTDEGDPGLSDTEEITITVGGVNRPPILDPIGSRQVNEGAEITFTVTGSDPDGDELTYSADKLPPGASFDPATRVFSWTPGNDQSGSYPNILFTVVDDGNPVLSDTENIVITVSDTPTHVEIIIDNSDPGFQIIGSGEWDSRTNPPWPSYGSDFQFNLTNDGNGDQAVYTFNIPVAGNYEVYGYWPSHAYCSQDTPYTIDFSTGPVTVRVDQQQNSGQWNWLSTGFFEAGNHQVVIADDAGGIIVVADAVRIVSID